MAFADNAIPIQKSLFCGKPVINPNDINKLEFDDVIIASQFFHEICSQLVQLNVPTEKITLVPRDLLVGAPHKRKSVQKIVLIFFLN